MAYAKSLTKQYLQLVLAQCPLPVIQLKAKPSTSETCIAKATVLPQAVSSVMCQMRPSLNRVTTRSRLL